ncbi:SDR family NAD(P)-dependent oxidoreductase [Pseudoalteromonas umbrosa]|uniref:SDR family NAD(P)-dependent oxidoreductase n=1 Tax=Pseudoalteromonas umbrosa TaxID=3048489 RepID=UPI0024C247EE|nr:SDR family NAD(P)-dependent oxidoreductase [Pseudoalteromonas sp. B95]MDK1286355.1 SDR family NAD(P)-dependent oxidoreductase [Pseudoalteromonas sp. B95]
MSKRKNPYGIPKALYGANKSKHFFKENTKLEQKDIYQLAVTHYDINEHNCCVKKAHVNNSITRQLQPTCHDLDELERTVLPDPSNRVRLASKKHFIRCYQCHKFVRNPHPTYLFCCYKCGALNQKYRHFSRQLTNHTALVTGGRTKLGHQIALKLLRADCQYVIVTTRNTESAKQVFSKYPDYDVWKDSLILLALDLDTDNLDFSLDNLKAKLSMIKSLDILVNCAAQTIRARDKSEQYGSTSNTESEVETNRYGDPKFVSNTHTNSWHMRLNDFQQQESEECYRINAVAPTLLIQKLTPLLKKSLVSPYIINVHAREGVFNTKKADLHLQTNMAKAALHMLTKCLARKPDLLTESGKRFAVHGCDPGWFSVDEYYEDDRPWVVPPLDEIDGAARILFPLFAKLPGCSPTRRHFYQLSY